MTIIECTDEQAQALGFADAAAAQAHTQWCWAVSHVFRDWMKRHFPAYAEQLAKNDPVMQPRQS